MYLSRLFFDRDKQLEHTTADEVETSVQNQVSYESGFREAGYPKVIVSTIGFRRQAFASKNLIQKRAMYL